MKKPLHLDTLGNRIESVMARMVVRALLNAGYKITVSNGWDEDSDAITKSTSYSAVIASMAQTDEEALHANKGHKQAWVNLIYGNGGDCISDFSLSLDALITPITAESVFNQMCAFLDNPKSSAAPVLG